MTIVSAMTKCKEFMDGGLMEHYHDAEWGHPCHNEQSLYEQLMLECLSAGLNWRMMLQKREVFRACFAGFDYAKVALFTEDDVERIVQYPGMIRSHRKTEALIHNARQFMAVQQEFGSFDRYIWGFTGGKTYIYRSHLEGTWLTTSRLSDTVAKDLRRRGFKFLGSTLVYSYLQSIGVINDHWPYCDLHTRIGGMVVIE